MVIQVAATGGTPDVYSSSDPMMGSSDTERNTSLEPRLPSAEVIRCPSLAFVEGSRFQAAITILILANVIQLAVETDVPDWSGWPAFEVCFMAAFTTELLLRIAYKGEWFWSSSKESWWAVFDTGMVALGLFEACLALLLDPGTNQFLRTLRMTRLGRTFRIFHVFPRLALFFSALINMMHTFVWVFSLLFLFCLLSAITSTHILGKGEVSLDDLGEASAETEDDVNIIRLHFGRVESSLFTLFQLTTQDNWCDFALPVVSLLPGYRLFFVGFIVLCSWTMISMLTAVASDSMLEATTDKKEVERRMQLQKQEQFIQFLKKCFQEGDADGNGELDKEEFEALVQQPHVIREMSALGAGFTTEELTRAWAMLDFEETGKLTIEAFVEGVSYLMDTLTTRHILSVDGKVKRNGNKISKGLSTLSEELQEVQRQNKEISFLCRDEELWQQEHKRYLEIWKQWAQQYDQKALNMATNSSQSHRRGSLAPPPAA